MGCELDEIRTYYFPEGINVHNVVGKQMYIHASVSVWTAVCPIQTELVNNDCSEMRHERISVF